MPCRGAACPPPPRGWRKPAVHSMRTTQNPATLDGLCVLAASKAQMRLSGGGSTHNKGWEGNAAPHDHLHEDGARIHVLCGGHQQPVGIELQGVQEIRQRRLVRCGVLHHSGVASGRRASHHSTLRATHGPDEVRHSLAFVARERCPRPRRPGRRRGTPRLPEEHPLRRQHRSTQASQHYYDNTGVHILQGWHGPVTTRCGCTRLMRVSRTGVTCSSYRAIRTRSHRSRTTRRRSWTRWLEAARCARDPPPFSSSSHGCVPPCALAIFFFTEPRAAWAESQATALRCRRWWLTARPRRMRCGKR